MSLSRDQFTIEFNTRDNKHRYLTTSILNNPGPTDSLKRDFQVTITSLHSLRPSITETIQFENVEQLVNMEQCFLNSNPSMEGIVTFSRLMEQLAPSSHTAGFLKEYIECRFKRSPFKLMYSPSENTVISLNYEAPLVPESFARNMGFSTEVKDGYYLGVRGETLYFQSQDQVNLFETCLKSGDIAALKKLAALPAVQHSHLATGFLKGYLEHAEAKLAQKSTSSVYQRLFTPVPAQPLSTAVPIAPSLPGHSRLN